MYVSCSSSTKADFSANNSFAKGRITMKTDTRTTKEAVYLIDEEYMVNAKNPVPSGWDADRRGAKNPLDTKWGAYRRMETRDDGKYPLIMSRKFMPVRSGKASFRQIFRLNAGSGFNIEFYNLSENAVLTSNK